MAAAPLVSLELGRLCEQLTIVEPKLRPGGPRVDGSASYILASIYFAVFSVMGVFYISALRYRIKTWRDPQTAIDADKRLSTFVYVLPVLTYMVLYNATVNWGMSQEKCDLCMFGLISGMLISLYKKPSSRSVKLVVWVGNAKRCLMWMPSAGVKLGVAQQLLAQALKVEPASRVRFPQVASKRDGDECEYALDMSKPLVTLLGDGFLHSDFFGHQTASCHVVLQSAEAASAEQALRLRNGLSPTSSKDRVTEKASLIRSISRVFSSKKGGHGHEDGAIHKSPNDSSSVDGAETGVRTPTRSRPWIRHSKISSSGSSSSNPKAAHYENELLSPSSSSAPSPLSPRSARREIMFKAPKPRKDQIEAYVDAILRDPSMNLPGLPDKIEKKIYTIGISMALTACLKVIFSANGKNVLGHHVELEILQGPVPAPPSRPKGGELAKIEKMVDELLKEEMINISWLPDKYEKPLYVNVIVAILTVMESFFAAARMDFLGQVLTVNLSPADDSLQHLAEKIIMVRRVSEEVLEAQLDHHFATAPPNWIPDRFERPMYKTMYALVLCVIDEVFKDMKINFLGDQVLFHLVPGPMPHPEHHDDVVSLGTADTSVVDVRASGDGRLYGQHEVILAALTGALVGGFLLR